MKPKFVRRYASLKTDSTAAVARYAEGVRAGRFPSSDETYHVADDVAEALGLFGTAPAWPLLAGRAWPRRSWRWLSCSSAAGWFSSWAATTTRRHRAVPSRRCSRA